MAIFGVEPAVASAFVLAVPLLISAYFALHLVLLAIFVVPMVLLKIGLERGRMIAILVYFLLLFGTPIAVLFLEDWLDRRFGPEIEAFWGSDWILIESLRAATVFPLI